MINFGRVVRICNFLPGSTNQWIPCSGKSVQFHLLFGEPSSRFLTHTWLASTSSPLYTITTIWNHYEITTITGNHHRYDICVYILIYKINISIAFVQQVANHPGPPVSSKLPCRNLAWIHDLNRCNSRIYKSNHPTNLAICHPKIRSHQLIWTNHVTYTHVHTYTPLIYPLITVLKNILNW